MRVNSKKVKKFICDFFNVCCRLHIIAIISVQLCSSYKGPHFHLVVRNTSILHTNSVIQIRFPRWYYTSTP